MDLLSIAIAGFAYVIGRRYACIERDQLSSALEEVVDHAKTKSTITHPPLI
jgi:hypothetical protein